MRRRLLQHQHAAQAHRRATPARVLLAGIMLVVWIAVELGFLRAYAWLQPVYLVIGAAVVGLAWLVRPRPPRRKPVRRDHAQPPGTRVDVLGRW